MKMVILTVRDRSADVFGRPFFHTSVGAAGRSFVDEINRPAADNIMYQHPEDFDLYELGEYEDNTAVFKLLDRPRQILIGKDCAVRAESGR